MSEAFDPHDPQKPRRSARTLPWGAILRILILAAFIGGYFWAKARKDETRRRIAELDEQIARLRDQTAVKLWDARTGEVVAALKSPKGYASRAVFTADGNRLAGAGSDKCVYLWNLSDRAAEPTRFGGFEEACRGVAVTPDGKRVAGVDRLGVVRAWDAANAGEPVAVIPGGGRGPVVPTVRFVAGDPNLVLVGDPNRTGRFWRIGESPPRMVVEFDRAGAWALGSDWRLAFAPSEPNAAARVWDVVGDRQVGLVPPPPGLTFKKLRFAADHTRLAAVLDDGTVRVFDPAAGIDLLTLPVLADAGTVLGTDADGRRLYTTGAAGVTAWDPLTGARIGTFPTEPGESFSALGRVGPYLVGTRSAPGVGAVVWRVPGRDEPEPWSARRLWDSPASPTFSDDASLAVRGGLVVNPESGEEVAIPAGADPTRGFLFATFSPDGRVFAGVVRPAPEE